MAKVYDESKLIKLDSILSQNFDNSTWSEMLGDFELLPPSRENINQWIGVISSWVWGTVNIISAVKMEALEQLLRSETAIANAYLQSKTLPPASTPSQIPQAYATLLPEQERKRQTRLVWWDRFQTADGWTAQILTKCERTLSPRKAGLG